jgi:hypothetical protein
MGMILGKIIVETPKHEVLHTGAGYEIRKYPPCIAAEFTYYPKEWKGDLTAILVENGSSVPVGIGL